MCLTECLTHMSLLAPQSMLETEERLLLQEPLWQPSEPLLPLHLLRGSQREHLVTIRGEQATQQRDDIGVRAEQAAVREGRRRQDYERQSVRRAEA